MVMMGPMSKRVQGMGPNPRGQKATITIARSKREPRLDLRDLERAFQDKQVSTQ